MKWDLIGEHIYETGTKNGAIYPQAVDGSYPMGIAWNGLIGVTENPSGAESTPLYADDIKYLNLMSREDQGLTIEAYTYPDEFAECDGTALLDTTLRGTRVHQQTRKAFGFVYKTVIGNDVQSNDYGYKLHINYGCTASPSQKGYKTISENPEAITFSWEIKTTPVEVPGAIKPTATITIDSTKEDQAKLAKLEEVLFGSATEDSRLPLPEEIIEIMNA